MLAALPVGFALPGPGGLPMFLIGFALVTFPGKRKLTSRVMRGRGLPLEMNIFTFFTAFVAIVATCVLMWFLADRAAEVLGTVHLDPRQKNATVTAVIGALVVSGLFSLAATWLVMRLSLKVLNYVLRGMPIVRRKMRPWLRKKGIILLPSRHRQTPQGPENAPDIEEILEIHIRHQERLRSVRTNVLIWGRRALAVLITAAIFAWILKPIHHNWGQVRGRVMQTSIPHFVLAAGMFAVFLFAFRALVWRRIVESFGTRLPVAAATRIWSTSELARYLPGVIWQVVGRVYLVKPYGVSGSICSITQVLELAIFLLANILVALTCLCYFGLKNLQGPSRDWMYVAAALVPVLLALLHTKVFYGIINAILRSRGKPPVGQRLRGHTLIAMLGWNILGLLWQSLAIFLIVQQPLGLKLAWWWVVAGAYCLAWCAGFLAFWAPGGIGVREIVFVGAMQLILPGSVREMFVNAASQGHATLQQGYSQELLALLAFMAVLLRLWTTAGEVLLAAVAYGLDMRGALGHSDAPGRNLQNGRATPTISRPAMPDSSKSSPAAGESAGKQV